MITEGTARRIIAAFDKGGYAEVQRVLCIALCTAQTYMTHARKILGIKRACACHPRKGKRALVPLLDVELVERLWSEGKSGPDIDQITGCTQAVAHARRLLGIERIPSHSVKKLPTRIGPVSMRELDRHFMRKVGDEFIFRRVDGVEEVWLKDATGTIGPYSNRYRFSHVLGMMERRIAS